MCITVLNCVFAVFAVSKNSDITIGKGWGWCYKNSQFFSISVAVTAAPLPMVLQPSLSLGCIAPHGTTLFPTNNWLSSSQHSSPSKPSACKHKPCLRATSICFSDSVLLLYLTLWSWWLNFLSLSLFSVISWLNIFTLAFCPASCWMGESVDNYRNNSKNDCRVWNICFTFFFIVI